jgi:hypothetical protein
MGTTSKQNMKLKSLLEENNKYAKEADEIIKCLEKVKSYASEQSGKEVLSFDNKKDNNTKVKFRQMRDYCTQYINFIKNYILD